MLGRSLLRLDDLSAAEIGALAARTIELARAFKERKQAQTLRGQRIALIVDEPGWRNPTALTLGMQLLGADCTQAAVSLSGKEAVSDLGRFLANWFDLIAVRSPSLVRMRELAQAAAVPVLNLRTRENHPCETLGDLCFVKLMRGSLEGLTVVAIAPAGNILHSWAEAAEALPLSLIQVYPEAHWVDRSVYRSPRIRCTTEISETAVADVIVTDCWPQGGEPELLREFSVNADLLDQTKDDCLFIPCPPVTRGEEVTDDAMNHARCVVYDAKAYLMHAQNAYIEAALLADQ